MPININPSIKFFLVVKPFFSYQICYAAYRVEDANKYASEHFGNTEHLLKETPFNDLPYGTVIRRANLKMDDVYNLPYISQGQQCHAIA